MKSEDVRAKSDDELGQQLLDLRKESFNLRFQRVSGQLENTARVREVRREVPRTSARPAAEILGFSNIVANHPLDFRQRHPRRGGFTTNCGV